MTAPLRLTFADEGSAVSRTSGLSLRERVRSYLSVFPQCDDAVWIAGGGRWLYGIWQIGADYRNGSTYYGAYPKGFLQRVTALFPEIPPSEILHAFSGSLPPGPYTRLDLNPALEPDLVGNVYDVATLTTKRFQLVIADPQYSAADGEKYGTPPLNRGRATHALAQVTTPGGHLVWLDTTWPMHRKTDWHYYGAIELRRSTNHRLRGVSLFERKPV